MSWVGKPRSAKNRETSRWISPPSRPAAPRRRELERLPAERVPLADLVPDVADDERPRDVRVAGRLEVDREEVEKDDVVRADRPRAHVVPDRGLRAVRDDHLLGERAVREERRLDALLQELARERLAVEVEAAVRALRAGEELARGRDACLGGLLCSPDPRELVAGLPAPAVVEEPLVDGELDPRGAQRVRMPEREPAGHRRLLEPEPLDDLHRQLGARPHGREPAAADLVRAELLGRLHVQPRAESLDAASPPSS